jgi:hypothetical protein
VSPIERGSGTTKSERYLAALANRTFLDLWSYPNTFNDRKENGKGNGKELTDLLVVCGDDIVIFSDKSISWPSGDNVELSWSRWYRRAVEASVKQIRGAERWIRKYPDRIFVDAACKTPLPVELPLPNRARIHGIAVALGAQDACSSHFNDPDGSLMVNSDLKGRFHVDPTFPGHTPFAFGDVDPDGPFVHVFDETALDLVLREMDTITDFVRYLGARQVAIRERIIGHSVSEAEILAVYLTTDIGDGEHGFPSPKQLEPFGGQVNLAGGMYREFKASPAAKRKLEADRISYAWDKLILKFTENVLAGTSVAVAGIEPDARLSERSLRVLALEPRTSRRALGQAFVGALAEAERRGLDRFARVIVPGEGAVDPECGHVFLVVAFREPWMVAEGYDKYRLFRSALLKAYCEVALYDNRQLKRMLGVAVDASARVTGNEGGSEDLLLLEIDEWTPEHERDVKRLRKKGGILVPARLRRGGIHVSEFPPAPLRRSNDGNRAQRRAAAAQGRKNSHS